MPSSKRRLREPADLSPREHCT